MTINGSWVYTSRYFNNVANEGPLVQAESASIYNLTFGWVSEDNRYNAALDLRNLADTHYVWSGLQSSTRSTRQSPATSTTRARSCSACGMNF